MVDRFDPNQLRHDLLRLIAHESVTQQASEGPGVWSKCAGELGLWFRATPIAQSFHRLRRCTCCRRASPSAEGCETPTGNSSSSTARASQASPITTAAAETQADVGPRDAPAADATSSRTPAAAPGGAGFARSSTLYFLLERPPGAALGIDVLHGSCLTVHRVHPGGLMGQWNLANPSAAILPRDRIVEVNGNVGDSRELLQACETQSLLQLKVLRGGLVEAPSAQGEAAATSSVGVGSVAPSDSQEVSKAPSLDEVSRHAEKKCRRGFPLREIFGHLRTSVHQLTLDVRKLLFLAFPEHSPYRDRTFEALFQDNRCRRHWFCLDWSSIALALMLFWDIAMNPLYRLPLVVLFYAGFFGGLILRKIVLFAGPSSPTNRRFWHNVLLVAFFFGRCVVCQPLFVMITSSGLQPFGTLQVEAFSSVIGLGMTNLSMVVMQQLQTVDMFVFCIVNGVVFVLWIVFVLNMPLTDALHTAYVGSIVVTAVCVRQQRDLEDIERRSFEHELVHARSLLVRSSDNLAMAASSAEFASCLRTLSQARRVEHLNF